MQQIKQTVKSILILVMLGLARLLAFLFNQINVDIRPFFKIFWRAGFYLLKPHYYLPLPDEEDLKYQFNSKLIGINMQDEAQLRFTREIIERYRAEFTTFPTSVTDDPHYFYLVNGTFMAGDSHAYYAIIRHMKPKVIIEIGAGKSTLLASHALAENRHDDPEYRCNFVAIEPYPADYLHNLPGLTSLKSQKLQEVEINFFEKLGAGDILFIDSSHGLKSGGDVWLIYCEIIPRLKSGVYIHLHDISLPKPYPQTYFDEQWYWNEQYVLQTLLTHNDRLEVIWAGTYLFHHYPEQMKSIFSPDYEAMRKVFPLAEPSSFWLKVR